MRLVCALLKESPPTFTRKFAEKIPPRISAKTFSWQSGTTAKFWRAKLWSQSPFAIRERQAPLTVEKFDVTRWDYMAAVKWHQAKSAKPKSVKTSPKVENRCDRRKAIGGTGHMSNGICMRTFNKAKTGARHFCVKSYKTRCTPVERDRIKDLRSAQHPERDRNEIRICIIEAIRDKTGQHPSIH